jgi:hypothetical protein
LWRWKGLSSSVVFSERNLANAPTVNPLMSMTCSKPNHSFQSGTTPREVISSCCWVKMPWAKKEDDELQGLITCAKHRRRSNPLCWYCSKEFWGKIADPLHQHSEYIPISATHSLPFCVLFGTHLEVCCPLLEKYEMQRVKKTLKSTNHNSWRGTTSWVLTKNGGCWKRSWAVSWMRSHM